MRQLGVNILNAIEISPQEAAWFLLQFDMCTTSRDIMYVNTLWTEERHWSRKTKAELEEQGVLPTSCDIWHKTLLERYEHRPVEMEGVTFAEYMVKYNRSTLRKRQKPAVLRCRNNCIDAVINCKREHVMLYVPFRKELDILDGNAFKKMFDDNEKAIIEIKQRYSAGVTMSELISACEAVGSSEANRTEEVEQPEERLCAAPTLVDMNDNSDLVPEEVTTKTQQNVVAATYPGVHRRDDVMPLSDFHACVRLPNEQQAPLIREVIHHVTDQTTKLLQIFFTEPAGCGKTSTLRLIMDVYNRYCRNRTILYGNGQENSAVNAYVACATTGKAAVALNGVTVHSAFEIVMTNRREERGLTPSDLNTFRMLFRDVKCIIVDEVSMLSLDLLRQVDLRLRKIKASKMTEPFRGFDVISCADLRQLPPVRASEVYKKPRSGGSIYSTSVLPWHHL
ncbi:uncharacterized protein LOC142814451 [Rhipicephalus microplus]|uniref:uncharacterized protein LOC142814451 n=1 Tax=Rhipicephalus microplus TaxID=6941 RepID=UPI003F6C64DC